MKLDSRIKALSDILTCFDTERAEQFIGEKGYFSNGQYNFVDLKSCGYGTLGKVFDGSDPFQSKGGEVYFSYFLPESCLKPAEKKWRPFSNTKEFFLMRNFAECDLINIRSKANNFEYHLVLVGWTDDELMLGSLRIMSLNELFQKFELWDDEGKFIPFGVEE